MNPVPRGKKVGKSQKKVRGGGTEGDYDNLANREPLKNKLPRKPGIRKNPSF